MAATLHGYRILRWGDYSLLYKNGEIRQLCLGDIQVLNAIYAAVRDQNWATIPYSVRKESIQKSGDGFRIAIELEYAMEKIHYSANISIEAIDNKLIFTYIGEAGSSFLRNRIGICILHPITECRGKPVIITHPDGSLTEDRFPELISPHQPFFNISGMQWKPGKNIVAGIDLKGDIFESEDQRNWTDASYKTYSTPLDQPFPVKVKKGEQVHQSLTLTMERTSSPDKFSDSAPTQSSRAGKRILTFNPDKSHPLPELGVMQSMEEKALTREESEILSTLPFQHYRVDLHLSRQDWIETYNAAATEQQGLGWPLELALHFGDEPGAELHNFLDHYNLLQVDISHFLIFDLTHLSPMKLLKQVVPDLKASFPDIPLGGGTDANFAEFNRHAPDPNFVDFCSYSICPQIHAFDKLTLVENLEAQTDSVSTALNIQPKAVHIGAISLKQRFNAVATDDENQARPESDPRQHTSFAAGWTMCSIRNLALAAASSLTYYETAGPRGILCRTEAARQYSPLYYLFKEILSTSPLHVIHSSSSHPLEFDCLALKGLNEIIVLVANFSENEFRIEASGLVDSISSIFQLKDEGWVELATPESQKNSLILKPTAIYRLKYST